MGGSAGTAARLARRVLLAAVAVARQVLFTAPACSMAVAVTVGLTESQGAVLRSRKYVSIDWGMIISNSVSDPYHFDLDPDPDPR